MQIEPVKIQKPRFGQVPARDELPYRLRQQTLLGTFGRFAMQTRDHRRILQWFGHYLKGEPALPWISNGMTFLEREQELKLLKTQKGKN